MTQDAPYPEHISETATAGCKQRMGKGDGHHLPTATRGARYSAAMSGSVCLTGPVSKQGGTASEALSPVPAQSCGGGRFSVPEHPH